MLWKVVLYLILCSFFFSSRRRHTRLVSDWSSDVCSSDLPAAFSIGHGNREVNAAIAAQLDKVACGYRYLFTSDPMERSEEHTSELQSLTNLVCRLLLEKINWQLVLLCVFIRCHATDIVTR